jgi:multidrug efflux pump
MWRSKSASIIPNISGIHQRGKSTIYLAFFLVVVIIFVFLRDWRTTIIPILVIPVSLVGSFFIMYLAGFTINVLTLLAIVLSIGLVVDDAIVMMENIYVKIEQGMTPLEAGLKGSDEIFFAIISTTITLIAVFFPIVFLEGMTGRLIPGVQYCNCRAVAIPSFVALTFTPMLSTKLLKTRHKRSKAYNFTEKFFEALNRTYQNFIGYISSRRRYVSMINSGCFIFLIYILWKQYSG